MSDDYFVETPGPMSNSNGGTSASVLSALSGGLHGEAGAAETLGGLGNGGHEVGMGGAAGSGGREVGMGGAPGVGGGAAGTTAAVLGPFGPPTLLRAVSSTFADDDDPCFTADGLELYFNSNRSGGPGNGDIWVSKRVSTADPWGVPTLVAELSSTANESTPRVSPDGLTLWVSTDRAGCVGSNDIWISTRATRTQGWSAPSCLEELNSPQMERSAGVSASLLTLVFTSERSGVGGTDLYWATRPSVAVGWGTGTLIPGVNSTSDDGEGQLVLGGLELYFASDRNGPVFEIFVATRPSLEAPFGNVQPVTELNSSVYANLDPWLSEDGRYIVFGSTRSGNGDLYEASR